MKNFTKQSKVWRGNSAAARTSARPQIDITTQTYPDHRPEHIRLARLYSGIQTSRRHSPASGLVQRKVAQPVMQFLKWKWEKGEWYWYDDKGEKYIKFVYNSNVEIYEPDSAYGYFTKKDVKDGFTFVDDQENPFKNKRKLEDHEKSFSPNKKREYGDSNKLANNRYDFDPKKRTAKRKVFKTWKKDREAHHIIPAHFAKESKFSKLRKIIDSTENGMMLPIENKPYKNRVYHKKGTSFDHPKYNKTVEEFIKEIPSTLTINSESTLKKIMKALRSAIKKHRAGDTLNDLTKQEFIDEWNDQNPLYKI